jgi:hypothetical protein
MAAKKKDTKSKKEKETKSKKKEDTSKKEEQNEFIQGASLVINTLAYTPELKKAWEQYGKPKVVGEGEGASEQPPKNEEAGANATDASGKNEDVTKQVSEVVTSQRESIISDFEKEYGIKDLKDDDRKEARRKVESYLNEFGWSVRNIPLRNLRSNLEKAYLGSNIDKLKEEGKLEGIAQLRANEKGTIGALSGEEGSSGERKQELTKGQAEWAEKLGVDPEEAKEKYVSRDEEYKRKAKAEEKKED